MKQVSACLLVVLLVAGAMGQNSSGTAKPAERAAIEGLVTKNPENEPVKKALIELIAENQAEGGDYTAVTGPDGIFRIENILPGRYHLFAERPGFLDVDKHRGRSDGRVLTLAAGQELKDLRVRVQAAAVVRGRVTDEDGDPLPGAEVTVLRQTFVSGHHHWEQVGAERTNDLGEYRVAGLPAGIFYVSVTPPPDFKSLIQAGGASGAEPHTANAAEKTATAYQTTYYPGTTDRSQATPVQLHAGDDFPVNFSLVPGPSLSIRGSVVNLPPRTSATIMLQSRDFNLVMTGGEMHKDGSFVIRDVSPGSYTILATIDGSPVPMMARQSLQVGSSNVDGVRLTPQPGAYVHGQMRLVTKGSTGHFDPNQIFLALQPVEGAEDQNALVAVERFSNLAHVSSDGSFEWKDVPPGSYYVQIVGDTSANEGWFLKSVTVGGREVSDSGVSVNGGAVALDLIASATGGSVDGVVLNHKGETVGNAVVVAVPETRMRGRLDRYGKTVSDQSGHFILRGVRPGDYTMLAWESVDGEAYYNPEFLKGFEAQGSAVRLEEGERKTVQLEAIPDTENEP
jgi:protocatechuate 3,4-dioxygenase beta subunit